MTNLGNQLIDLKAIYKSRFESALVPVSTRLEKFLSVLLSDQPRIDRISARPKSVERFLAKAKKRENETLKYDDPLNQIQDQIGARIITFYLQDVETISNTLSQYFRAVENRRIVPDREAEFGYFGRHFIFFLTNDVLDEDNTEAPIFFELQVKTLFQHAWAEANHDVGYKELEGENTETERRLMAYASAQAWGADRVFDELFTGKTGAQVTAPHNKTV